MRLLHTADWHLGRAFHGEDLLGAQAAFVDFVVEAARSAQVDGVLIAGDLYDRALPPVDAVRLASEALARLAEVAPVVAISGNHDSAARLGFGAELLARAGVHVRTDPARRRRADRARATAGSTPSPTSSRIWCASRWASRSARTRRRWRRRWSASRADARAAGAGRSS